MPPKKSEQLKRAAADLDDVLNDSPVKKKKSKPNLAEPAVALPDQILPPPEVTAPDPQFIDTFEPEAALRLTRPPTQSTMPSTKSTSMSTSSVFRQQAQ